LICVKELEVGPGAVLQGANAERGLANGASVHVANAGLNMDTYLDESDAFVGYQKGFVGVVGALWRLNCYAN
jgi:hypothetical protein